MSQRVEKWYDETVPWMPRKRCWPADIDMQGCPASGPSDVEKLPQAGTICCYWQKTAVGLRNHCQGNDHRKEANRKQTRRMKSLLFQSLQFSSGTLTGKALSGSSLQGRDTVFRVPVSAPQSRVEFDLKRDFQIEKASPDSGKKKSVLFWNFIWFLHSSEILHTFYEYGVPFSINYKFSQALLDLCQGPAHYSAHSRCIINYIAEMMSDDLSIDFPFNNHFYRFQNICSQGPLNK